MKRASSSLSRNPPPANRPSSVSLSTRMSTRSSNLRSNDSAGAGLRIVVAPAVRARSKKASIVANGISNWLAAISPFSSITPATSAASTSALAPGITTIVLSAFATVMMAVPVWAPAVCRTKLRSIPSVARNAFNSSPKASWPSRPISVVDAPSLADATAWFAPLPPGKYKTALPATVSPTLGCRSAVATTSMLMLPATKTRPMHCSLRLDPDLKLLPDGFDVGKRRQPRLVAEALDLVGGRRAREFEMVVPGFARIAEVGKDVGAMEHVTGAIGVDHARERDRQRWQGVDLADLVVPEQTLLSHGDAADPATAALEIVDHLFRREVHLFAQPLGDDGDIDELQELMSVGAQAAAIERGQDAGLAAQFGIVDRGIRLVTVDMQHAAIAKIEQRERMDVGVVAAAHDRAFALLWHDKGQRRRVDLARMDRDSVLRAHVLKHPSQPVIGDGGDQVRHNAELGAAERRSDGVAAERDRIGRCNVLLVAGRHMVGNEGNVDIGLSDKESLHSF